MIEFKVTSTTKELKQILALQQENLRKSLTEEEIQTQGFVTVEHDFDTLYKMHEVHPHTIAKDGDKVIGYVLSMSKTFGDSIEVLKPMFAEFKKANITDNFIIMGQVCVAKGYRGKGVFRSLYNKMAETFSGKFTRIITEVDALNTRSLNAHKTVGFTNLCEYEAAGQLWKIIALDI